MAGLTTPARLLPAAPGLACLALLSIGLPTRLWPLLVTALVALGMSIATERWPAATAFGLLTVALAGLQDNPATVVLAGAGLLLGLYLISLSARAAPDGLSLRAWLTHQLPQAALLALVVAMVPLGELFPARVPTVAVAVGGLSITILFWWIRSRVQPSSPHTSDSAGASVDHQTP